ncbi:MAG: PAS domain-containing protein [Rhodobiaceae bacterium]|nr:PAS domain-containing protein [Rhodobiaceae bacterium]
MEIRTEGARELYAYWDKLRTGRAMPRATEVDLVDLAPILPNVVIYAATDDNDFRFRFFGTGLVRAVGADLTGLRITDIMDSPNATESINGFTQILAGPLAAVNLYQATAQEGGDYESEHLLLPLGDKNDVGIEILCHAKRIEGSGDSKTFEADAFSGLKIVHRQVMELGQ